MALLVCESSKPAREQLHRSEIEPDLTAGDGGLKVFGEAAVAVEPSEGSFDHPAARQDTRAGTIGPFDDVDSPPAVSGQCRGQLITGIAAIGQDMAQPREQIADRRQQARCHRALARRTPASPTASSMDEIRIPCRAQVGLRRVPPVRHVPRDGLLSFDSGHSSPWWGDWSSCRHFQPCRRPPEFVIPLPVGRRLSAVPSVTRPSTGISGTS
jgi:hypothetical protein